MTMRGKRWRRYESLSISERYTLRPYQASVTVTVPSGSFTISSCNASRRDPVGECLDDVTRRQSWSDFAERAERERGGKARTFLDTEFL